MILSSTPAQAGAQSRRVSIGSTPIAVHGNWAPACAGVEEKEG